MPTPYLIRRHQTYYLRVRVPADLAPLCGTHLTRTLRTGRHAEARTRAAHALAAVADMWARLRADMADQNDSVLPPSAVGLTRPATPPGGTPAAVATPFDAAARGHVAREALREFDALAERRLAAEPLAAALSEVLRAAPIAAPAALMPAPSADLRGTLPMSDLLAEYHAHYHHGASSRAAHAQAVRDFETLRGRRPIGEITAADLAAYRAELQARPGRRGRETAATATVTKSLNQVRAILKWANKESGILKDNAGENVRPPRKKKSEGGPLRQAFEPEALTTIFKSPLYTGCAGYKRLSRSGPYTFQDDRYYFLLCMLLTGARTEELPGSRVIDHGGTPCLDLRKTGTKSPAGARLVPIIPALARTGFPAWAARQAGGAFRGPHAPGDWSKWSNRYLTDIGVTDRTHVAYSLRHNYRQMLRAANLNIEVANTVFGHETGTAGEGYGRTLTVEEAALVARTVRPPVDLSHLRAR